MWALTPLAAATLIAGERPANAVLTYYIYESGPDVIIEAKGSLDLRSPSPNANSCTSTPTGGAIYPSIALFCTGLSLLTSNKYSITGPTRFFGLTDLFGADSFDGLYTELYGDDRTFSIDSSYASGPISGSATFFGQTLSGLGYATPALLGTWTLTASNDTINVVVGAPPSAVPGPLPLFGAAAAFSFSRRLRRRVSQGRSTSPSSTSISA